jgi:hypothetical protein
MLRPQRYPIEPAAHASEEPTLENDYRDDYEHEKPKKPEDDDIETG